MTGALAAEVERLRDRIASRSGLTRQEIARAMGVDRRSLSGFVAGEIRPTEERLRALRVLADTADWSANEFGEYAREVLRGPDPESSPLLLIAKGETDLRRELVAAAERAGVIAQTRIQTRVGDTAKEPLYLKAADAWQGKGNLPTRTGVPRPDADYQIVREAVRDVTRLRRTLLTLEAELDARSGRLAELEATVDRLRADVAVLEHELSAERR